ncbi:adenosylmethionine decarboxylase [bacterium]|nr:adenosylmethionine decarboxylase [bacterium]MBU1985274.1 adenosylmethionine decarboxylase [bacterium]
MKALGRQIVVEYYGCNPDILNDVALIKRVMRDAAIASGATIVQEAFHLFNPHGVSGVVVIAESHLTIHTWPEYAYAAVDLFTCGDDVDPDAAFQLLKDHLGATTFSAMEMKRGILNMSDKAALRHKPDLTPAEV